MVANNTPFDDGDDWDDEATVLAEFPKDKYEHIPVRSADEGRMVIATRAMQSNEPLFGEARWFSHGKGVMLLPIQPSQQAAPKRGHPLVLALGVILLVFVICWVVFTR